MTIIAEMGGWHIEFHRVTQAGVAAGGVMIQLVNLDRPGRFMGLGGSVLGITVQNVSGVAAFDPSIAELPQFGAVVDQMQIVARNNHSVAQDMEAQITIFIRD